MAPTVAPAAASPAPSAPPASAPGAASAAQNTAPLPAAVPVKWTLDVIQNGQQIDSFSATTSVGQARTDTHHKVITHNVGCKDQPAGSIDLARTITVSPLRADASGVIFSIDAQETLENAAAPAPTTAQGCKLPPQPRQISASHPGLVVPPGQTVSWQIVDKDPSLAYRVSASVAPQPAP
ncbi:hypothetical protein FAZ98_00480 [Paraburkholderia acidisoli]|uniref:Uncharacterized protein n=2 Tax=Paraburkholderia acidisoli TaxID=2571748 RepID=A0A7Z2JFJ6_9BURK|nr:hypothetical protein FAZ98_00480 [Paraburkholderia acidisoli]